MENKENTKIVFVMICYLRIETQSGITVDDLTRLLGLDDARTT